MTGLIVSFFMAGIGGLVFNGRIVGFEQSRRQRDTRLVQTQLLIGSVFFLITAVLMLGFRLNLLGA